MTAPPGPRVLVLCRAGSLLSLPRTLSRAGRTVERIETIRTESVRMRGTPAWLRDEPPADLWIVTSRAIADTFLRPRPEWRARLRRIPEVVAVGSDTRRALASSGFRHVRSAPDGGNPALLRVLGRRLDRRVLYLRSDRAGPGLARELRRRGARVRERVVYRVRTGRPVRAAERRRLGAAVTWAVSSPSALDGFRTMLGAATFDRRIARVDCVALGPRTARALRAAGARRVAVARPSTQEGLTKLLAKELRDASDRAPRARARR